MVVYYSEAWWDAVEQDEMHTSEVQTGMVRPSTLAVFSYDACRCHT